MKNIIEFLRRFGFLIFNALLLVFVAIAFARAQDVSVKDAMRQMDLGQQQKAIQQLRAAINDKPEDAFRFYYLGLAQLQAGDIDAATQTFENGFSRNEKEPLNYAGKGHALLLKKNAFDAKVFFDRALDMSKSKNVPVLQAIARAYLTDKKTAADALALLEKAKSLAPENPETFLLLGDAYLAQNNGGSAVSSYEWAAQYDPRNAKPHYKIAMVYLKTKEYKMAEDAFLKAVGIDKEYAPAWQSLAELSYLGKNGPQAVKYFETYLSLGDRNDKDQLRYAFFLFMAKDFAKANVIFAELSQKEVVSPATLRYYAYSLFEAGDFQQSKNMFEKYFAKASKDEFEASDYGYYAKLLVKLNEDSLAVVNLGKSIALDKNQWELVRLLAETQLKLKKYPASIATYRKLMANGQRPLSQDYYSGGRAYYFNGQFAEADTLFSKLIELQPSMVIGYLWEGRAKSNLDPESELGLAKPYYEKLIELAGAGGDKYKNELIEAYSYLGYYHFLKAENQVSKSYWTRVLTLNPNNEKAKEAIKALH